MYCLSSLFEEQQNIPESVSNLDTGLYLPKSIRKKKWSPRIKSWLAYIGMQNYVEYRQHVSIEKKSKIQLKLLNILLIISFERNALQKVQV